MTLGRGVISERTKPYFGRANACNSPPSSLLLPPSLVVLAPSLMSAPSACRELSLLGGMAAGPEDAFGFPEAVCLAL